MSLLEEFVVATVLAILTGAGFWVLEHHWGALSLVHSLVACTLWRRSAGIRVSFSAILRVASGNRYVLARMAARPEAFGPFGGVYQYLPGAASELHACEYQPVTRRPNTRDLRGFVTRGRLLRLTRWFLAGRDRETSEQCLKRELREELQETSVKGLIQIVEGIRFQWVRTVYEKPRKVPGRHYQQFRCFHIYELDPAYQSSEAFLSVLVSEAATNRHLLLASSSDIEVGRAGTALIGHHAEYLFHRRASRPDLPQPDFERLS